MPRIDGLPAADALQGDEPFAMMQGGKTKNATPEQLLEFFLGKVSLDGSGNPVASQPAVTNASVNSQGHLILTRSDGQILDAGSVVGPASPGIAGPGFTSAAVTGAGHLVLTRTDGTTLDLGNVSSAIQLDGVTLATNSAGKVAVVGATAASLTTADPSTLGTDILVVTNLATGVDQRTTGAALVASQTIAMTALPAATLASADLVPFYDASASAPAQCTFSQLVSAVAAAMGSSSGGIGGGTTPAAATTFTAAVSSSSGTIGSTTNLTVMPGSGGWPSGQIITPAATGVSGTFDQSSKTGSGTNPVVFVFTSTAAGSGTLSATASGMTLSGSAASYAATASSGGTSPTSGLTMTNATYADRGDGSGKKMLTGGTASGPLPVAIRDGTYFNMTMKFKAGSAPYASTSVPFIKVLNSAGQAVGVVLTGTQCVPWTSDYAPNPSGTMPTDGAIHELAFTINGQYINALSDGAGQGQGQLNANFNTTGPQLVIDMSKGPPGVFSVAIRDGAYSDHMTPWETYEFDGSGAAS